MVGHVIRGSEVTAVILADRSRWTERALELRKDSLLAFLQGHGVQANRVAFIAGFQDPLIEYVVRHLGARVTYREDE